MPLGTRGGMKAMHTFPADGEYRLTITNLGAGLYPRSLETRHTLVVLIDRHEEWRGDIGGEEDLALIDRGGAPARERIMKRFANIPLQVKAGAHEIAVTFIERSRAASDELVSTFTPQQTLSSTGAPRVPGIEGGINLIGPFDSPGLSPTASRKKLFVCEPEVPDRELACAQQITSHLARLAFRRPVSQADLDRLMPFYEEGRKGSGGFDEGIELMVTAVLASPDFLYRAVAPRGGPSGGSYALADAELASRLSFFLWGQGPDDTLLGLAAAGRLSQQDVLDEQVRRMLKDPRAAVLVDEFALRWLHVQDLDAIQPDKVLFPEFTDALRGDFAEEIRLFLSSVLLEDKDVRTLLTANYTFVNERLARHYGVPDIVGPQFRRVTLEDPRRFGLLGKGAVLLRTSYGDRTSPVLRGQWVLDKLMGTPPTPPPPGVDTNLTQPPGEKPKTVRARLEQHRDERRLQGLPRRDRSLRPRARELHRDGPLARRRPRCRRADRREHRARRRQEGHGADRAQRSLLERRDQFVQAFTQKLMMYALGRELEYYDMPEVRAIVRTAAAQDYRFSALVTGIVRSDAFRMQAVVKDEGAGVQASADPNGFRQGCGVSAMYLTKKHLSRRTVLKGAGVALGLPLLDAMIPAATALANTAAAPQAARRILLHPARRDHVEHGVRSRDGSLDAERRGRRLQAEPDPRAARGAQTLRHLVRQHREPRADELRAHARAGHLALGRASRREGDRREDGADDRPDDRRAHRQGQRAAVARGRVRDDVSRAPRAAPARATTARRCRSATRRRRCRWSSIRARCSCSCSAPAIRPRSARRSSRRRASVLDMINARTNELKADLGPTDRAVLDGYLESVRETERRVEKASQRDLTGIELPDTPIGELPDFDAQVKLMFDLIALAYQADITRVASYIMVAEGTNRTYNHIGVSDAFHPLSHHANNKERIEKLVKVQRYHVERFAEFVDKLAKTPDGEGSLLDHSMLMYGSNMSNSDRHNNYPLPIILVGGARGALKGGQHMQLPEYSTLSNLHLTVLNKAGVEAKAIGDSSGADRGRLARRRGRRRATASIGAPRSGASRAASRRRRSAERLGSRARPAR